MTARPKAAPGRRLARALAGLGALSGSAAHAVDPPPYVGLRGSEVRAVNACFSNNVRVTGFFAPRSEAYVTAGLDGYRVTAVLVSEGDRVAAEQELIRLTRIGAPDQIAPSSGQPLGAAGPTSAAAGGAASAPPGAALLPPPGSAAGGAPTGAAGLPPAAMPPGAMDPRLAMPATMVLRAPAAGYVSKVNAVVGSNTTTGGDPLMRVVTSEAVDLVVSVPSPWVSRIRAGAPVRIVTEDEQEITGEVRTAPADVDPATQFGRAWVATAPSRDVRTGLFASAFVDTARRCGVSVPRAAILRQNNRASVQVVRDGRVETRRVRVGLSSGDRVEIREGLAEGETVLAGAGTVY